MADLLQLLKNSTLYDDYTKRGLASEYAPSKTQNLNIGTGQYTQGVGNISPLWSNGAYGLFNQRYPNEIRVNAGSPDVLQTTGHEAYHLQADKYSKYLKDTGQENDTTIYGMTAKLPAWGTSIYKEEWRKRLEEADKKYAKKYNLGAEFASRNYETMADLQGIEASLPSGQTILDTDIGKDLFKTKSEQKMYLQSSLPGIMKALEYDPSLWEIAKDRADYAMRVFKDKATASSYAKAAADAFKAFMSGPEAKVEYQDPFGDTTK